MRTTPLQLLVCPFALLIGCDASVSGSAPTESDPEPSGRADDAREGGRCGDADDCDDGVHCNGLERCEDGFCRAGQRPSCDDHVACTRDACDETGDSCQHTPNHASCDGELCDLHDGCGAADRCAIGGDCDDGVFCNGLERCGADGACDAGQNVACDDGNDCTVDLCVEQERGCRHSIRDTDGDGHGDSACRGGDDCDDEDPSVHPGAREICDDHADDDCDRDTDCGDPFCAGSPACERDRDLGGPGGGGGRCQVELCRDGLDNDGDRLVDCADRECAADRACAAGGGDGPVVQGDPCAANGWYGDGGCDHVCARRDPDCDAIADACAESAWYSDGVCDDACRRTDDDCPLPSDDSCRHAFDGRCDEPSGRCASGTDTSDCRGGGPTGADSCRWANDGVCDEGTYCPAGTDATDCRSARPGAGACGNLTFHGRCDGAVLSWCQSGAPTTRDCARDGRACGFVNNQIGHDCVAASADTAKDDACGDLTWEGECAGQTLRWCGAGAVQTRECGGSGLVCGWQSWEIGYNCLAADAGAPARGCGGLDFFGECDGQTLRWCQSGELRTSDCAASGLECRWQDGVVGYNCLAEREARAAGGCGTTTWAGECAGGLLTWCDGEELRARDCTAVGLACAWRDDAIGYDCVAQSAQDGDACGGLDFWGQCEGETLSWCQDGELRTRDCASSGLACGWRDVEIGWDCLAGGNGGGSCGGVDVLGTCDGDVLVWCQDDELATTDCADFGLACSWRSAEVGFDCVNRPLDPGDACACDRWEGWCDADDGGAGGDCACDPDCEEDPDGCACDLTTGCDQCWCEPASECVEQGDVPDDSCLWSHDGVCDEPDICPPGTDSTDCRGSFA